MAPFGRYAAGCVRADCPNRSGKIRCHPPAPINTKGGEGRVCEGRHAHEIGLVAYEEEIERGSDIVCAAEGTCRQHDRQDVESLPPIGERLDGVEGDHVNLDRIDREFRRPHERRLQSVPPGDGSDLVVFRRDDQPVEAAGIPRGLRRPPEKRLAAEGADVLAGEPGRGGLGRDETQDARWRGIAHVRTWRRATRSDCRAPSSASRRSRSRSRRVSGTNQARRRQNLV